MMQFVRCTKVLKTLSLSGDFGYTVLVSHLFTKAKKFFGPHFEETVYGSKPRTKAGGVTLITLAPGIADLSVWESVVEILQCAGAPLEFEWIYNANKSDDEFENVLLSVKRNGIGIKGNFQMHNKHIHRSSILSKNMAIRRSLDLFVRVNWIKSIPPLKKLMKVHKKIDIVLIRQNTEGEFSLIEYMPLPIMCEHLAIVSRYNSKRVAEYAFKYSKEKKRKKITLIVNKMVIPKSEEIFSQAFLDTARDYPEIQHEVMDVAGFTLKLQYESDNLDVILASSLIGSMLHSIMQGYLGSSELIPSLNTGERYKVWESAYTSSMSENLANLSNPISHLCIFISILKELGAVRVADAIFNSMWETLAEGVKPNSLGGTATVEEFTRFLISCLKPKIPGIQCAYYDKPKLPPKPPAVKPFRPEFMPGMVPPNPNYKKFPPEK